MLLLRTKPRDSQRGAALMLALLVLFILVALVFQLNIGTGTDARVARNDIGSTELDLAVESSLLEVMEQLKADGEQAQTDAAGGAPSSGLGGALGGLGGGAEDPAAGAGASAPPTDSHEDEWARPQRTEIGKIELRIFTQDEDSKYNLLALLTEDEEERTKALDRLARIIDLFREGTAEDIDSSDARELAETIREHLERRNDSVLPRPTMLTDRGKGDDQQVDYGLPLSLREFVVLPGFEDKLFRDYRDEDGEIVHSLASFVTVWTALQTREEFEASLEGAGQNPAGGGSGSSATPGGAGDSGGSSLGGAGGTGPGSGAAGPSSLQGLGQSGGTAQGGNGLLGGGAGGATGLTINLNTAPPAVLKALFDDRDVRPDFWDSVIEYRNIEQEPENPDEELEPVYDEFGEELIHRQIFEAVDKLNDIDGWENLEPVIQSEIRAMSAVQSQVFSVFIVARKRTGASAGSMDELLDPDQRKAAEQSGDSILRSVRCTVWRRTVDGEVQLVPIERWEVLDYVPYEVLDLPDEDR